jgi:hypothetical protein
LEAVTKLVLTSMFGSGSSHVVCHKNEEYSLQTTSIAAELGYVKGAVFIICAAEGSPFAVIEEVYKERHKGANKSVW